MISNDSERFGRIEFCNKEGPIEDGKIPYYLQSCRYKLYEENKDEEEINYGFNNQSYYAGRNGGTSLEGK